MTLQNKVLKRLQTLDPDEMILRDLAQMFEVATKVEREVRGLPAKVALTPPDGEKAWTPTEIEKVDELERVLAGSSHAPRRDCKALRRLPEPMGGADG